MKIIAAALVVALLLPLVAEGTPVGLQSLLIDPGVIASGMGYAYTAVADDPSALYWNPAGLTRGREGVDFLLAHTEWFVDHRMEYVAASWRRGVHAGAAGISGFYVGGIERRDEDPTAEPLGDFGAYDIVVSLAYARRIGRLRAGVTAKPFYTKIDRVSAHGVAADLGLQVDTPLPGFVLGAALANLGNKPNYIEEEFSLPVDFRTGAAYRRSFEGSMPGELIVSAEIRKSKEEDARTHAGFDLRLREIGSFRFGYKWGYDLEDYSFGIGVIRPLFSIEYAFVPFRSDFGTVHRFGIRLHRR